MSVAAAFVHELFEGFWHRLHGYDDPPPRTVPAAADWPEWEYPPARAPWEDEH